MLLEAARQPRWCLQMLRASTAVPLGRAWGYGLAAGGEAGVSNAIAVNGRELDVTLALMVVASIDEQRARGRAVIAGANGHLAMP